MNYLKEIIAYYLSILFYKTYNLIYISKKLEK